MPSQRPCRVSGAVAGSGPVALAGAVIAHGSVVAAFGDWCGLGCRWWWCWLRLSAWGAGDGFAAGEVGADLGVALFCESLEQVVDVGFGESQGLPLFVEVDEDVPCVGCVGHPCVF